jgi:hypothetical protein
MESNKSPKEPMVLCVHLVNTRRCWENQCTYYDKMWENVVLCCVLIGSSHFFIV